MQATAACDCNNLAAFYEQMGHPSPCQTLSELVIVIRSGSSLHTLKSIPNLSERDAQCLYDAGMRCPSDVVKASSAGTAEALGHPGPRQPPLWITADIQMNAANCPQQHPQLVLDFASQPTQP